MKVFVERLPSNCSYCDFCHTRPYDSRCKIDGEKFCGILNEDVEVYYYHGDGVPEFCPLKEIPEEEAGADIYDEWDTGWQTGWNTFRRIILGEYDEDISNS